MKPVHPEADADFEADVDRSIEGAQAAGLLIGVIYEQNMLVAHPKSCKSSFQVNGIVLQAGSTGRSYPRSSSCLVC